MMKSDGNCGKYRELLKDKKRIVVKIGSSSLQHPETGDLDYTKLDVLVRELCNMRNRGMDVVLVTSGAIAVGKKAEKNSARPGIRRSRKSRHALQWARPG